MKLGRLVEVFLVEGADEVPPLLLLEEDVGLLLEGVEALHLLLGQLVVLTKEPLPTVVVGGVGGRFSVQQVCLGLHSVKYI